MRRVLKSEWNFSFRNPSGNPRRVLCVLVVLGGSEGIESERLQNRSRARDDMDESLPESESCSVKNRLIDFLYQRNYKTHEEKIRVIFVIARSLACLERWSFFFFFFKRRFSVLQFAKKY